MQRDDFIVEVRDRGRNIVGQVHPDDLRIQINDLKNDIGNWRLLLPVEHPMTPHLRTPGAGIVVTVAATGDVLFSGPTVKPENAATADDPAGTVTIEGVSDSVNMADRLAVPDPATAELDEQGLAHDVRTGPAETLMYQYVNANAGPGAPAARRVAGLTVGTSRERGPTLTKRARFPVLGNLINELAAGTMLRWSVRQFGADLRFAVEEGRDLTADIRLDIYNDTLAAHRVAISPPGATRVLVAGQGNLVDRQFIEMTSEDALAGEAMWGRRIERFVDQRQTDDPLELDRAGKEVLDEEGFSTIAVQVVPMEDSEGTATSAMRFWWDWFIGDKLAVVVEGQEMTALVTGYALKIDENGARVGAVLGDPAGFSPDIALTKRVDGIALRVDNLERADPAGIGQGHVSGIRLSSGDATATTSGVVIGTVPAVAFKAGRAYELVWDAPFYGTALGVAIRKGALAGSALYSGPFWPGLGTSTLATATGRTVVRCTANATFDVVMVGRGSGVSSTVRAAPEYQRALEIYDIGPAARFATALDVSALA